jgi:hypothetical protein
MGRVTIHLAHTALINPPGTDRVLTAAQAWAGLQRKARRPQDFVPVVDTCEILSEVDGIISCIVVFKRDSGVAHAKRIKETCTLKAPCRLDYEIEDGSSAVNIISFGPGGELLLTFGFAWLHEGLEEGSDEMQDIKRNHQEVSRQCSRAIARVKFNGVFRQQRWPLRQQLRQ